MFRMEPAAMGKCLGFITRPKLIPGLSEVLQNLIGLFHQPGPSFDQTWVIYGFALKTMWVLH